MPWLLSFFQAPYSTVRCMLRDCFTRFCCATYRPSKSNHYTRETRVSLIQPFSDQTQLSKPLKSKSSRYMLTLYRTARPYVYSTFASISEWYCASPVSLFSPLCQSNKHGTGARPFVAPTHKHHQDQYCLSQLYPDHQRLSHCVTPERLQNAKMRPSQIAT
ncbi:hypothetical protein BJX66DRAFT_48357 [Aspergillus keveii]|uniref:Secreted protein n=1 Tax=Aspergillus keveii TaxID=714993 RepID=A0ABR4FRT2_9EURO